MCLVRQSLKWISGFYLGVFKSELGTKEKLTIYFFINELSPLTETFSKESLNSSLRLSSVFNFDLLL